MSFTKRLVDMEIDTLNPIIPLSRLLMNLNKILKILNILKSQALMIGDNYPWDYKPARSIGVDALLVESDYMKKDKRLKVVKNIAELMKFI